MPSARRAEAAGERWQTLIYHHGRARSGVGGHGLESVVRAGYVTGPLSWQGHHSPAEEASSDDHVPAATPHAGRRLCIQGGDPA